MKIKEIKLQNFGKHVEKNIGLTDITLIKGDNGSGKSTILESISYALNGTVRRLPKKLENISKLSSNGQSLSVELITDENTIVRTLEKGSKLSESIYCSSFDPSLTNTEKNIILRNQYNLDELLINPINFINLSSSDKSKYIISLLNDVTIDRKELISNLSAKFKSEMTLGFIAELDKSDSLVDSIDSCLKTINSQKRVLSKELSDNGDAFKIEDLKKNIGTIDIKKIDSLSAISNELNQLKFNLKIANEKKIKRASLKKEIDLLKSTHSSIDIKSLTDEIKVISSNLEKLYLVKENTEEFQKLENLKEDLLKIKEAGLNIKSKLEIIASKIANLVDLNLRISTISQSKRCVIDDSIVCNNNFSNSNKKLLLEIDDLKKQSLVLQSERNNLVKLYKEKDLEISNSKLIYEKSKIAFNAAQEEIIQLNKKQNNINVKLSSSFEYSNKLSVLEESFKSIIVEDTTLLEKLIFSKEEELNEAHALNKKHTELSQALKLAQMNDLRKETKALDLNELKALEKMLKKEKLNLLQIGINPIKEDMNKILTEMNFKYKVFIENDGKKATLGFTKPFNDKNIDVEIDMLSTGETMIFIIALIGAIYAKKQSNFKFLALDDIDNLDKENLNTLFNMVDVLNKYFDNILLIGILNDFDLDKYKNINVINMND